MQQHDLSKIFGRALAACTYGRVSVFNSKWLRSMPAAISKVNGVRSPSASMAFGGSGEEEEEGEEGEEWRVRSRPTPDTLPPSHLHPYLHVYTSIYQA